MKQHQDLMRLVLETGERQSNRTGVDTLSISGAYMRFDLRDGFPAVTTRKLPFRSAMGELCGFLRGYTNAIDFRVFGCKVWDQNANENEAWLDNPYRRGLGDLGPIYGASWRAWPAYKLSLLSDTARRSAVAASGYEARVVGDSAVVAHKEIDQLSNCIDEIRNNPTSRRILFHAWDPARVDEMALPPCHVLYQFLVAGDKLSMCVYLRSNDLFLGAPYNIAEAAALLTLVARLTDKTATVLNYFVADAHIYVNHIEAVAEQLSREPFALPQLELSGYVIPGESASYCLDNVEPDDFQLIGYEHHPAITAPMAV